MVTAVKAAIPTVSDQSAALQLRNFKSAIIIYRLLKCVVV